jgi:hypothetical protein
VGTEFISLTIFFLSMRRPLAVNGLWQEEVQVRVTVFLSFVPFPIPERRIKDSRANNLQVEINRASAIGPLGREYWQHSRPKNETPSSQTRNKLSGASLTNCIAILL